MCLGCSQVHLLKARGLWLQPGREGDIERDIGTDIGAEIWTQRETKRQRVTHRDEAEYIKVNRMSQRSHSTGLVQDCLEILAPDEILKVVFIFIQILRVFFFCFLASSEFTHLMGWPQHQHPNWHQHQSKFDQVGGAGHKVMLLMEGRAHAYVFPSPGFA